MIRAVYGKPAQGMTYEPVDLSAPAARRELRLLCLLVPTRNGETRSLPVHTLRPMPPRLCAADSHNSHGQDRWCLDSPRLGMGGDTGLYLRETHATVPTAEVLERCARHGQTNALRADPRTIRAGGLDGKRHHARIEASAFDGFGRALTIRGQLYGYVTFSEGSPVFSPLDGTQPTRHRTISELRRYAAERYQAQHVAQRVQGRAPGLSEHASPFGQTEARAKRTLDPARTETASARECGAASPPRAPEPSAARVG